ncbi:hypothetical protein [Kitasatospora sp. NPDC057198]|uniref:hypothetical protein n=1 Tax=Kitasatospora sp. NPDC057198 TaxID=3346046 RepID=UPI00362AE1BC
MSDTGSDPLPAAAPTDVPGCVDELVAQMRAESEAGFRRALGALGEVARAGGPAALTAAVEALAPLLPTLHGVFARTAVLAGACVERGGSPAALAGVLPARTAAALRMFAMVPGLWAQQVPDGFPPPPDWSSPDAVDEVVRACTAVGARGGFGAAEMRAVALSWFDAEDWLRASITVLGHREFRAAADPEELRELRAATEDVAELSLVPEEFGLRGVARRALWADQLAAVLDDEPLIVLDPGSGRGFALTMSGVGDNFQLHTLLADRLIGSRLRGLLPGEPPARSWVAAATGGSPRTAPDDPVLRRFRLFDGHGRYVAPEGIPADIRPLDGVRVLVLHPPRGRFGWTSGRVFEHLVPSLRLERRLPRQEAAAWLRRTAPAREDDLLAPAGP